MSGERGAPIVVVDDLSYHYPYARAPALQGVSLAVETGEMVGVVGPNGAGKTTLCLALAGLVPQLTRGTMRGRVVVAGLDTARTPVHVLATRVGVVFQNPFHQLTGARHTVEDEIAFGLENLGVPPESMRRRVEDAMERVGIAHLRARNPFMLSGGQLQRLAIACMLAQEPQVLVLDEPTSQLDPRGTAEVLDVVASLRSQGVTVVMVEHKLELLAEYAGRIVLLDRGRVAASGAPGDVLASRELERAGLEAPAYARIATALGARTPQGAVPVTLDQAASALRALPQAAVAPHPTGGRGAAGASGPPHSAEVQHGSQASGIVMRDVHFAYPASGTRVFEGLSLAVGAGGSTPVALVGENGAGKTTWARLATGLLRPQRGAVEAMGRPLAGMTAARVARLVGLVFQNPDDQLFRSRALDEAAFGALNLGVPPDEALRRAHCALDRVGLRALADENPYDLHLSQRKLLALASILAMQTPALILDEPTIAQDHPGIARLARLVAELTGEGRLVVAITHDMEFVARAFPAVVVMAAGQPIASGPARDVFAVAGVLERAGLQSPYPLRLARALGLPGTPLTTDEFVTIWKGRRQDRPSPAVPGGRPLTTR